MIPLAAINQLAAVYRGRGRNEAYLEFAQEHFLDWLRVEGLFEDDAVVFKGGTAIRKFVLGNEGRFSTDLDFAVTDPIYADHILELSARGRPSPGTRRIEASPGGSTSMRMRHPRFSRAFHDQCHNIEPRIPGQIRTVMNVQESTAKALLVDQAALEAAQAAGDVLGANALLMDAYNTDVRPLLADLRRDMGLDPDPMAAYARSGYAERIAAERVSGAQAGWGA